MNQSDRDLADACQVVDPQKIEAAVKAGADVNDRHRKTGVTPFITLLRSPAPSPRLKAAVEILVNAGACVRVQEWTKRETPLILACSIPANGDIIDIVKRLLQEKGVAGFINKSTRRGYTALAIVCDRLCRRWNRYESDLVRLPPDTGADPDAGDEPPLVMAANARNRALVLLLIRSGAVLYSHSKSGGLKAPKAYDIVLKANWPRTCAYIERKYKTAVRDYWLPP